MSSQKRGIQYENDVAKELHKETDGKFIVRAGYSGNGVIPSPDVYVRNQDDTWDTAIELKKVTNKRDNPEAIVDYDDFENLLKLKRRVNHDVDMVFGYKFANRELVVHSVPSHASDDFSDVLDRYVETYSQRPSELRNDSTNPPTVPDESEIRSGPPVHRRNDRTIVVKKPDLDTVDSASAGRSDAEVIKTILP